MGTDDRLLQLTEDTGGTLVTADFNLAQVARVKKLKVMNLSELVIALRPEVQPGDELNLKIVAKARRTIRAWPTSRTARWWWWKTPARPLRTPLGGDHRRENPSGRMVFGLATRRHRQATNGDSHGKTARKTKRNERPTSRIPLGSSHPRRCARMTTSAPYYGDSSVMRTPPPDLPSLLLKERIVLPRSALVLG